MALGQAACCRCEVYAVRDGERVELPACTVSVTEPECPPSQASITFSTDDEFWVDGTFDFSCEYLHMDRVCTLPDGSEERELIFRGAADMPAAIDSTASTFGVTFTDDFGILRSRQIPVPFQGTFDAYDLMAQIAASVGLNASGVYVPPPGYPTLPATPIVITAASHPGGPMTEPTFAAMVAWCTTVGALFTTSGGVAVDIETYLYADEAGAGGSAPGNPGPWDELSIEGYPYADGQTRTVVYERYVVGVDGSLCRETLIDRAADGAPPYLLPHFNRCAECKVPGNIVRDIRPEQCLSAADQIKSIANEIGATILFDQTTGQITISQDPGAEMAELRLSTLENLCRAKLIPASGGYNEICLTGVDDSFARVGIPNGCRPKVKRANVAATATNEIAVAFLLACAYPAPACEVVIDPTCDRLPTTAGGYVDVLPRLHQYADVEIAQMAADGTMCPHPSSSTTERKPISRRLLEWDSEGNETVTLSIGTAPPTAGEMLSALLQRAR